MIFTQERAVLSEVPVKIAKTVAIAIAGSAFLALMSQLAIHLPFTPVPVTMQTLAIFLLGAFLGSRNGALSVIAYLAEGTCGLPVFAGGIANPLWFCGPKAGYLIGFVLAAYTIGKIIEKRPNLGFLSLLGAILASEAIILSCGALVLSLFLGVANAVTAGILPFLAGACYKVVSASLLIRGGNLGRAFFISRQK